MTEINDTKTAVLYNASCPVCSYEINHYAQYSQNKALPIAFDDLNDSDKLAAWDIDPDTAARKLHVMKDGEVFAGIPAFIVSVAGYATIPLAGATGWAARCALAGLCRV